MNSQSVSTVSQSVSLRSSAVRFFGLVETSGEAARGCLSLRLLAALGFVMAASPLSKRAQLA